MPRVPSLKGFRALRKEVEALTARVEALEELHKPKRSGLIGIYNGHGNDDEAATAAHLHFDIGSSYYNSGQMPLKWWDEDRLNAGMMPIVGMASKNWKRQGAQSFMSWPDIAAGRHDEAIAAWAASLAKADADLWFAYEIEPEVKLNRGQLPDDWGHGDFVLAYRRIVSVMRPIAPRVQFCYWVGGSDTAQIDALYPGDDVIDRIGWDPYVSLHESPQQSPEQCWGRFREWLDGRTWGKDKPLGLFETGFDSRHGDAAAIAFWEKTPKAFDDLGLEWVTLFNRDSGPNTNAKITSPDVWSAYGAAMREIQS